MIPKRIFCCLFLATFLLVIIAEIKVEGKMPLAKILVVDDDPNILAAFETFLHKENIEMIGARDVACALDRLEDGHIGLVISDVKINDKSGKDLLLTIKSRWPKMPVIVISGYPETVSEEELVKDGADYFFQKPIKLKEMRIAIKELFHA
jgi:DNA-binding NtrC family response regulator